MSAYKRGLGVTVVGASSYKYWGTSMTIDEEDPARPMQLVFETDDPVEARSWWDNQVIQPGILYAAYYNTESEDIVKIYRSEGIRDAQIPDPPFEQSSEPSSGSSNMLLASLLVGGGIIILIGKDKKNQPVRK